MNARNLFFALALLASSVSGMAWATGAQEQKFISDPVRLDCRPACLPIPGTSMKLCVLVCTEVGGAGELAIAPNR